MMSIEDNMGWNKRCGGLMEIFRNQIKLICAIFVASFSRCKLSFECKKEQEMLKKPLNYPPLDIYNFNL